MPSSADRPPLRRCATTDDYVAPVALVRNVSFDIKGKRVLDQVDLVVERGSFHGIIGPNGAGKTTLLGLVLGFSRPTSGSIQLLGTHPVPRQERQLRRIGIQPQSTAFFPRMTVREHLRAIGAIFGASANRTGEVMGSLDLEDHADTRVKKLSGGERQRLAIASALIHRPEVLFLDEPTAGLDPAARHALVTLLQRTGDSGTTIVYTTHHLEEAERLCDTVSILDDGHLLVTEAPARLIHSAGLGCSILLPGAAYQADDIARIPAIDGMDITSQGVLVQVSDAASAFGALADARVDTTGAQVRDGTLEDVFLALTGRTCAP